MCVYVHVHARCMHVGHTCMHEKINVGNMHAQCYIYIAGNLAANNFFKLILIDVMHI